jgi:hypothetical protein|tara:strand:+ start:76 stop:351 length:276 start_codon:yes stop_codon:yes gene_type:complete
MIDFEVAETNYSIIVKIAKRAVKEAEELGVKIPLITAELSLLACHNTCPLRLDELLVATSGNLLHDVGGIIRHLNKETGELQDCFLPRYSL